MRFRSEQPVHHRHHSAKRLVAPAPRLAAGALLCGGVVGSWGCGEIDVRGDGDAALPDDEGLIAAYDFEELVGSSFADVSGGGHDAAV